MTNDDGDEQEWGPRTITMATHNNQSQRGGMHNYFCCIVITAKQNNNKRTKWKLRRYYWLFSKQQQTIATAATPRTRTAQTAVGETLREFNNQPLNIEQATTNADVQFGDDSSNVMIQKRTRQTRITIRTPEQPIIAQSSGNKIRKKRVDESISQIQFRHNSICKFRKNT